ncbi:hypothetical protein PM082_021163 [Marasmius tenuissimus]|nr:hypothetical protein PM082_021163 [Marasmius tenuissimus]
MDSDDTIASLLIAQLYLQDEERISQFRKGKAREHTPLTDEEYAFQVQAKLMTDFLDSMEDKRIAERFGAATEDDLGLLETMATVEQALEDDYRYALALSHGEPLPAQSSAQRMIERSKIVCERSDVTYRNGEELKLAPGGSNAGGSGTRYIGRALFTTPEGSFFHF